MMAFAALLLTAYLTLLGLIVLGRHELQALTPAEPPPAATSAVDSHPKDLHALKHDPRADQDR